MAMGIRGFVEYTNSLVDREGRLMSRANKKLRKHLSLTELNQLEKVSTPAKDPTLQVEMPETAYHPITILIQHKVFF